MVQNGLQVDQTSTNREQRASSKFKSRSTRIQGPSDSRASESCTEPALRLCFCHHWDPETIQGLKWSPDRSSKRRFLKTKPVTFNVPKASHSIKQQVKRKLANPARYNPWATVRLPQHVSNFQTLSLHFNCNQSTRHQMSHGPKFTAIKGS